MLFMLQYLASLPAPPHYSRAPDAATQLLCSFLTVHLLHDVDRREWNHHPWRRHLLFGLRKDQGPAVAATVPPMTRIIEQSGQTMPSRSIMNPFPAIDVLQLAHTKQCGCQ